MVQVVDLDQIRGTTRQLAVSQGVDMQLRPGHILVLGPLGRLEVNDDDVPGVRAPDEVDAAVHDQAVTQVDLYHLLDVLRLGEQMPVVPEISAHRLDARPAEVVLQDRKSTRLNSSHGSSSYAV